ncbi:MAG: two pore domain potassium channel family protein [Lewinellaceae bacterium]|nr:two pore domain potassium channel family protein [Saprospiraceae bacterium]MCB9317437.1 two pore domain potassium channel family protein [Lewinellaceae bacterium]MCB9332208.1 two pore domain potassium channel family protein [Lewinellaceae bacterium]
MKDAKNVNTAATNSRLYQMQLFVAALLLLLLCPIAIAFFPNYPKLIFEVVFSAVVLTGIQVVRDTRSHFYTGLGLGLFGIAIIWLSFFRQQADWLTWLQIVILLGFTVFLTWHLFRLIFFHKTMSLEIILASIAGYLILGFLGGQFCHIMELALPGSFRLEGSGHLFQLVYFSYSTLITLGYGDITPLTPAAKSLALLISISGQLYLTLLVAILVGKFLSKG